MTKIKQAEIIATRNCRWVYVTVKNGKLHLHYTYQKNFGPMFALVAGIGEIGLY